MCIIQPDIYTRTHALKALKRRLKGGALAVPSALSAPDHVDLELDRGLIREHLKVKWIALGGHPSQDILSIAPFTRAFNEKILRFPSKTGIESVYKSMSQWQGRSGSLPANRGRPGSNHRPSAAV